MVFLQEKTEKIKLQIFNEFFEILNDGDARFENSGQLAVPASKK